MDTSIYTTLASLVQFKVEINFIDKWESGGRYGFIFGVKDSKGWPMIKFGYSFDPKTMRFYAFKDCRAYCCPATEPVSALILEYLRVHKELNV